MIELLGSANFLDPACFMSTLIIYDMRNVVEYMEAIAVLI